MNAFPLMALADCCEIVSGATPSTSVDEYWGGEVCWATPKDLSDLDGHYISDTPRKLTKEGLSSCAASILPPNSVLFSSRAPIGHVAINTVPMATNQGFKSFVPKEDKIDAKFLFYWLRANRTYLESLGVGATFKEVSKAIVSKIKVPVPPLPEQRRIAAILDQADALRAKRREALAQSDSLTQSIFIEMFGDPTANPKGFSTRQLSELITTGDSINYGVVQPGDDVEDGVPLVRVGDLIGGRIQHKAIKRIAPSIENAYKRSRLVGDEILVSCVGSIGVVALATEADKGFNIARAVARIRLCAESSRVFIAAQLGTASIQRYFTQELRTVSQPTLNIKQLAETKVMCPPIAMQREFEARIAALDDVASASRTSAQQLDSLFTSLQHRAFQGAL